MMSTISTEKPSKYKRLVADTFIFALGNLGSKIILFFMVPLYTNCLSKAEYGIADLVFTVAQFMVPFVSLVIFDAVLRFGLSKNANKESVLKTSLLVIFIGSLITVAITPAFRLYEPLYSWRWHICLYVILTMMGNVELNYLKLIGKNKSYAMVSVLHTLVLAVANIVFLANFNWGIGGYLLATILGSTTTVIVSIFPCKIFISVRKGKIEKKLLKEMVKFSSPLILNNVSWWVIQSSDKLMIESMVGEAPLGLYTAATKIPSLINVIISIFSQAWGISSIKEFEKANDKRFYSDVFVSYSAIGFGAAVFINAIAKPFMSIYVSEEFVESWRFVPLLLVSASFSAVASYFGSLYGAMKKSTNNMCSTLCAAIVNIIINYFCIQWIGVWGAVLGTVVAYIVLALYRMLDVLRYIKFDPKWIVFCVNAAIVLTEAVMVSMDFQILAVSLISIGLFLVVNYSTILRLLKACGKMMRRKKHVKD